MAINVKMLARSVIDAAREVAGDRWPSQRAVAELELRKLAQSAADIEQLVRGGHVDHDHARVLFDIYRTTARSALLSAEGIGAVTAEKVVKASIAVIGKAITHNLGLALF